MSSYWERRAAEDMWEYMEDAEKTAARIAKLYSRSSRYLTAKIDEIFQTFKATHGLTDEEAKQLLNSMQDPADIEELKRKLRQTSSSEEKLKLLAELESPAYQFRINRLNDLQDQISGLMRGVYKQQLDTMTDAGLELCKNVYYKNVFQTQKRTGLGFSFSHIDDKGINKAMSMKWSGKNYSRRIWDNTEQLAAELKKQLMLSFVTGRSNRETAEVIQLQFAKGAQNARRLVRTEDCFLANQMAMKSYEECDIEKYQFVATLDLRTSEICRGLDGKVFKVSEQKAGVNCPPMHPYCRSTTISYLGADTFAKLKRRARDPETGKTNTVSANMTYKEWYEKNVKGNPKAELNEKKIKNASADRKQFERYSDVLGDDVPETLDKFQDLKYTKPEKWEYVKLDCKRQDTLIKNPELKLPNAEIATANDMKFSQYLFGGNHPEGLAKGQAFTSRLGYDASNWDKLQAEIIKRAQLYPVDDKGVNNFGKHRYEQKIIIYGLKDTPANVLVGWASDVSGTSMASAYIKEVKRWE